MAQQCKTCDKLLEKTYCKNDHISDFEFCIVGEIPYIKISFNDSRFNELVKIIICD